VLDTAFWRIGKALGAYPSAPINVILYSERQFHDVTGAPEWAGGGFDVVRKPMRQWVLKITAYADDIVQESYLRREAELNGLATRATQERAETERLALARIDQDRTQYVQNLAVFRGVLAPRAQQYDQVDWQRLAAENPADYVRLQAEAGAVRQQLNGIEQEVVRIQQQQQQEVAVRTEQAKRDGYRRLVEAIPEFADPQYAQKTGTELGQFLRGWGFSDQEIAACVDDRPLKLALALMNAEKSRAAVQSADRKRVPPQAPSVQRAGNSQPNGQDSKSRRMTQLAARFESSPTVEDAARIVREWMR
jgi:hypothetical protein